MRPVGRWPSGGASSRVVCAGKDFEALAPDCFCSVQVCIRGVPAAEAAEGVFLPVAFVDVAAFGAGGAGIGLMLRDGKALASASSAGETGPNDRRTAPPPFRRQQR